MPGVLLYIIVLTHFNVSLPLTVLSNVKCQLAYYRRAPCVPFSEVCVVKITSAYWVLWSMTCPVGVSYPPVMQCYDDVWLPVATDTTMI